MLNDQIATTYSERQYANEAKLEDQEHFESGWDSGTQEEGHTVTKKTSENEWIFNGVEIMDTKPF